LINRDSFQKVLNNF